MSARDLICFELPQWMSISSSGAEVAAEAHKEVEASGGGGSLMGLLTTFMLGWQISSYGLAEGFTRLSDRMKGKGRTASELAVILWAIGVFFGKLGFGQPALQKKKEHAEVEKKLKAKAKIRANIDRPIENDDIGRYIRYKHGEKRGMGAMVSFDIPRGIVKVKDVMTDAVFPVDIRTVSFVSDEEKK